MNRFDCQSKTLILLVTARFLLILSSDNLTLEFYPSTRIKNVMVSVISINLFLVDNKSTFERCVLKQVM